MRKNSLFDHLTFSRLGVFGKKFGKTPDFLQKHLAFSGRIRYIHEQECHLNDFVKGVFTMQYGYFDDARKEYVITTPRTPLPWINYLGSESFFALCSNTAGGYAFYRDARLRRLTRFRYNGSPLDGEGFRIYIKDGERVWNPGWQPTQTELDSYRCRHGLGYTVIEGVKDGLAATQELLVPQGTTVCCCV